MPEFGELADKAKEWAGSNPDKADNIVDKAADFIKGKSGGHEEQVDQFTDKAKGYLHGEDKPEGQPGQQGGEQQPPR